MRSPSDPPAQGSVASVQLPSTDLSTSCRFYREVFGWQTDSSSGGFTAPNLNGQFLLDCAPAPGHGPLLWIAVASLGPALQRCASHGGSIAEAPTLDQGERWLAQIADPSGNRIGVVAPARTARPHPLLTVRNVEASSRWYQTLLGLTSDHGGPDYERLLADGELVLQLHRNDVAHEHGAIADADQPKENGVLVWFGEVADFDGVVARAQQLGAPMVLAPLRNPPSGTGNGPGHRELWITDPDGYTVVIASPDGEATEI